MTDQYLRGFNLTKKGGIIQEVNPADMECIFTDQPQAQVFLTEGLAGIVQAFLFPYRITFNLVPVAGGFVLQYAPQGKIII